MAKKVLVAYASKYGSTAEIAEKIGEVLAGRKLHVEVAEVNNVPNLKDYDAVVIGSAVYIGKWRKDAVRFMKIFEKDLREKRVWIFSTGPTGKGDPAALLEGWNLPKNVEPIVNSINAEDVTIFHGALDMDKLSGMHRMMIKKVKAAVGDFRDWEEIVAWAGKIADNLQA
ncbi:MAG TPA: flavodoxin domain-containing protein [Bacteroidales bacterium]|nr:flavodoxin domain-containing protein [Bacteroidales bacterium]